MGTKRTGAVAVMRRLINWVLARMFKNYKDWDQ